MNNFTSYNPNISNSGYKYNVQNYNFPIDNLMTSPQNLYPTPIYSYSNFATSPYAYNNYSYGQFSDNFLRTPSNTYITMSQTEQKNKGFNKNTINKQSKTSNDFLDSVFALTSLGLLVTFLYKGNSKEQTKKQAQKTIDKNSFFKKIIDWGKEKSRKTSESLKKLRENIKNKSKNKGTNDVGKNVLNDVQAKSNRNVPINKTSNGQERNVQKTKTKIMQDTQVKSTHNKQAKPVQSSQTKSPSASSEKDIKENQKVVTKLVKNKDELEVENVFSRYGFTEPSNITTTKNLQTNDIGIYEVYYGGGKISTGGRGPIRFLEECADVRLPFIDNKVRVRYSPKSNVTLIHFNGGDSSMRSGGGLSLFIKGNISGDDAKLLVTSMKKDGLLTYYPKTYSIRLSGYMADGYSGPQRDIDKQVVQRVQQYIVNHFKAK